MKESLTSIIRVAYLQHAATSPTKAAKPPATAVEAFSAAAQALSPVTKPSPMEDL